LLWSLIADIADKLRLLIHGSITDEQIKDAKDLVLASYYKRLGSSLDPDHVAPDHIKKMKRVHQTCCESIRRTDLILERLLKKRAVTAQEQESIQCQPTFFQKADHLLSVLSLKPLSAYQHFLETLDATNQHHLHSLLEENGNLLYILTVLDIKV